MDKILVIGASGFVGGHLARALLADGHAVRCLARNPSKIADLGASGAEVVPGDILDLRSMERALESVRAAYISIHTLSPQPASTAGQGFMEVEMDGLRNIVAACRTSGTRRLIYLTSLGITPDGSSAWVRGRWETEQFLLKSGLDLTVIRPGQIVGVGGAGFDMMMAQARRSVALVLGNGQTRMRTIAIEDLVHYLVSVLDDPRAVGECFNVGGDEVLASDQMIDMAADVLGRRPPRKIHVPPGLLGVVAPLIERLSKYPRGSIRGLLDGLKIDLTGDPLPIRALVPRPPLSYRQALERAMSQQQA